MAPTADRIDALTAYTPSPADELRLRHLETAARYLFANLLPLPIVIAGFALLFRVWHATAPLMLWAAVTIATWSVTLFTLRAFLNDARRLERTTHWTVAIGAALFVSSLTFASMSVLFWVEGDRLNNILLYVVVAAGLASAGAQSAPSRPVCVANLIPYAAIFLSLSLVHEPFPINLGIASLQVCYVALVALTSRAIWRMSNEMLRLRQERRELVVQLQQALVDTTAAKKKAEAASNAKSEFLANMSHELRTPLNAVLGFSEIIKNRVFGDTAIARYAEYGEHIHFSGRHLLGLINDILDLSKIEAGKHELDEADVDLGELARDVICFVEPQARRKSLTLALDAPGAVVVRADERAMRQVIANLLSNAVKFTPAAGTVALRVARNAEGGVTIAVADTGVGIKPEDMARVLESFGQVRHDVATTDERGTGLGLPIVKGLIELHGGRLALDSVHGKGTTATVTLPPARVVGAPGRVAAA